MKSLSLLFCPVVQRVKPIFYQADSLVNIGSAFSCSPLSRIIWSDDPSCSIERLSGFGLDTMLRYVEIPPYVKSLTSDAFLECDLDSVKFN